MPKNWTKLSPEQSRMRDAVAYLQKFLSTYDQQPEYLNYRESTFIEDVLYGLGVALSPSEHQYATGFRKFKEKLAEHLKENPS